MILVWILFGCIAGIIAGLTPGLHSNNVSIILLATPFFGDEITAFILSMCITQAFTDFIPSIFIGAPSENTFESTLPGHRMLLEGKAYEAICYTTLGGLIAIIAGAILTPLFFLFIEQNSEQIIMITPLVLIFAIICFVTSEKGLNKKIWVLFAIIAAATQGILFQDQIFPLITGYFGIAGTLHSLKDKPLSAKQEAHAEIRNDSIIDSLIGVCGGAIVSIMPGIGSNTAAGIINAFRRTTNTKNYLAMIGSINVSNFFFSFATLFALSKARNGAMLALQNKILYTQNTLFIGTIIMFLAAGIGGISALILAKKAMKYFDEKNLRALSISTIILMIILVGTFNGINGLIALVFSTALGLLVITKGVKRSTCMSALIVPVLFFYCFMLT
jgi:putative membrane protein